ncbi:MAG: GLPGLI family protein [Pedobacter sp.]|nr:MAG: GLPGLI family protein [Pedobacter sp.]
MKTIKFFLLSLLAIFMGTIQVHAQYKRFPVQGFITYELKVNMFALLKKSMEGNEFSTFGKSYIEDYQKKNPQFKTKKSTLYFNKNKSLYTQTPEVTTGGLFSSIVGSELLDQNNIVAQQLDNGLSTVQKKVFDETYLLKDSIPKITWKITDETRTIAGYECRRANAVILDSVYVVAFYTDVIPVSSGPENFSGLPGMILGLALPHDHMTWFATEVKEEVITDEKLSAPTKGKASNRASLLKDLQRAFSDWGNEAAKRIKLYLL